MIRLMNQNAKYMVRFELSGGVRYSIDFHTITDALEFISHLTVDLKEVRWIALENIESPQGDVTYVN